MVLEKIQIDSDLNESIHTVHTSIKIKIEYFKEFTIMQISLTSPKIGGNKSHCMQHSTCFQMALHTPQMQKLDTHLDLDFEQRMLGCHQL